MSRDLYERCLRESSRFSRAVGFFSSSVFSASPQGFHAFFSNGGRIQIVTSPILSRGDVDAIYRGLAERSALARTRPLDQLLRLTPGQAPHELFAWLIATGRIDIRFAIILNAVRREIYHEKLGIFSDSDGRYVAFTGSANESLTALRRNFELIDVFRSWIGDEARRAAQKLRDFERLWASETPGLDVLSFSEAAQRNLLRVHAEPDSADDIAPGLVATQTPSLDLQPIAETLGIPAEITLHQHQLRAIRGWFGANGRGLYVMATGSGKTIAALATAAKLYEQIGPPLVIVIVCPYQHLVTQWSEDAREFGLNPVHLAISSKRWREEFESRLFNVASGRRRLTSFIATNSTFMSSAVQQAIRGIRAPLLLLADEVHNLGAPRLRESLPSNAAYRLGLSATPERPSDSLGTATIQEYFGAPVIEYGMKDALEEGVLCPYAYHPQVVELSADEVDEYVDLTAQIGRNWSANEVAEEASAALERLLFRRARLVGMAAAKLPRLATLLSRDRSSSHTLVYCGDGSVESPADPDLRRQVDAVTRMIGQELGMTVGRYLGETPFTRREFLRREFADGTLQCLVAIRCLDEGVDIPETRRAYILASSSNPRQFIQRRGRVLRRSPGKNLAEIYDFIVAPPDEVLKDSRLFAITRRLVAREMARVFEFANLAVNGPEALGRLLPLRDRLNLLDLGVDAHGGE